MAREMTITLDDDVAAKLEQEAQRVEVTPNEIINATLRRTLPETATLRRPFTVRARNLGVPLIDLACTARALETLDELERK
jgi:hypothetical protein